MASSCANVYQRLVALGEYGLSVIRGRITILGATLSPDHTVHHVYALFSHSLPVIRYLESEDDEVVIRLSQLSTGLRTLKKLSPLFCRLWNESATNLAGETDSKERSSFQIVRPLDHPSILILTLAKLFSTADGPKKMYLQHVYSPPEWNEILASVSSGKWNRGATSSVMICGPKGSGKSTFAKLLINRLLTSNSPKTPRPTATAKRKNAIGVLLLDLDPGQPEYSPPGQLSLLHLVRPNFGPPFAHPESESGGCTVIRSHSISAISPSQDSDHYMACVLDLLIHYRHYVSSNAECPLIINTPGWVLGTGLELLLDLIKHSKPTVVIYMSIDGPLDVVKALRDEAGKTLVVTLPSQISEYTTRTAAQLRTMQTMSYFHLNQKSQGVPSWKGNPLTSMPPWVVRYAGGNSGIVGIMCLGEQPPADMLKEAINGTLVAVVMVDDMSAIAGWTDDNNGQDGLSEADGSSSQSKRQIAVNTPEDLPYLNPDIATSPDPKHSRSLGLALVRGIDTESKTLHLLTPISPKLLRDMSHYGKSIVLVSGKLETPGWAYTEELYRQAATAQSMRNKALEEHVGDERGSAGEEEEAEEEVKGWEDAPWIERVEGHQGRGVGARVWKVRRDLGRGGDGV